MPQTGTRSQCGPWAARAHCLTVAARGQAENTLAGMKK
jgi:hypothetical protein